MLQSVYGLTETTAVLFQSTAEDSEFLMTSTVGTVSEHVEVGLPILREVKMCQFNLNFEDSFRSESSQNRASGNSSVNFPG